MLKGEGAGATPRDPRKGGMQMKKVLFKILGLVASLVALGLAAGGAYTWQ